MSEFRYLVEIEEACRIGKHKKPSWMVRLRDNDQLVALIKMIEDNLDPNYEVYIKAGDFAEDE